jgi:hypothetical protein
MGRRPTAGPTRDSAAVTAAGGQRNSLVRVEEGGQACAVYPCPSRALLRQGSEITAPLRHGSGTREMGGPVTGTALDDLADEDPDQDAGTRLTPVISSPSTGRTKLYTAAPFSQVVVNTYLTWPSVFAGSRLTESSER